MSFVAQFIADVKVSRAPAAAFAVVGIFWGSFAALVPDLKAAIGASDGEFGLAMLVAAFGALAAMWLAPRVDAALGARAMQATALALALAFALPGLTSGPMLFALSMVLASAGSGTLDVIMNTRVSRIEAETGRALMNLNHGLFSLAYAVAAITVGFLREAGVSPLPCFLLGLGVTVLLVPLMFEAGPKVVASEPAPTPARSALIWLGGGIILIAFMAEQATEAWSALHLERGLGGSAGEGAMGPAILGLTMGFGRLSGQVVLARVRETTALQYAAVIAAVGLVIAASASGLGVAYAGFAIMGLGVSVIAPMAYSAVGKRVEAAERAAVITRISVIGYFGFFIGPPLMGGVSQVFGLYVSFYTVAVVVAVIAIALAPALRRQ